MLITNVTQTKENRNISIASASATYAQTAKQEKTKSQVSEAQTQSAEAGATVSISAEGLDLSQGSVIQKDAYEQYLYQEMMESEKENAEAMSEGFGDMAKALEIARRIMDGDMVPQEDEKFLMEYDSELYMRVKSMARPKEDPKEYDSLLEDEEEGNGTTDGGSGKAIDGSGILDNIANGNPIEKMAVSI